MPNPQEFATEDLHGSSISCSFAYELKEGLVREYTMQKHPSRSIQRLQYVNPTPDLHDRLLAIYTLDKTHVQDGCTIKELLREKTVSDGQHEAVLDLGRVLNNFKLIERHDRNMQRGEHDCSRSLDCSLDRK